MKQLHNATFRTLKVIGGSKTLGDVSLSRCNYVGSTVAQFDDPGYGLTVRNVEARRCKVDNSGTHGVRFQNVLVEDLTVAGGLLLEACIFERVTLRGNIGRVVTTPPNDSLAEEVRASLVDAMRVAYPRTTHFCLAGLWAWGVQADGRKARISLPGFCFVDNCAG
ncbi:hypothetical protein [Streptomyces sp. V1I1]|uniref:hypothetical protein n=1 Tax=Streptomyces sp. V1I1 TaxID=3042272 RepID=UPI0027D7B217|nr:hypothetical protein [Streptomyces sp. V1I1]